MKGTVKLVREDIDAALRAYVRGKNLDVPADAEVSLVHHRADPRDPRERSYWTATVEFDVQPPSQSL